MLCSRVSKPYKVNTKTHCPEIRFENIEQEGTKKGGEKVLTKKKITRGAVEHEMVNVLE